MDLAPIKVASVILSYHGVTTCIVGELVLNYYNVPRVCHDLEICVLSSSSPSAAAVLCSTGLFKSCETNNDFNNYTEYKRHMPRIQTTQWCQPQQTIVLFHSAFFGFDAVEDVLVAPTDEEQTIHISKELEMNRNDIASLNVPRLAAFLKGLARRYIDTKDDVAMMAVEQLVDGMNLDEAWVEKQLQGSDADLLNLVLERVRTKKSRIDYYTENKITCFIADQDEADKVRLIPGFE